MSSLETSISPPNALSAGTDLDAASFSGPPGPPDAPSGPNVEWWQKNGGQPWLEEVERRRPTQNRYNRQEAWLTGHFASGPALRVLDFGCGYGRHLKNLKNLSNIELYGCDMSPTMIGRVGEYVGDPAWARDHVRQIVPAGELPYPDQFFDVTYSSEVLIHVHPDDLPKVLKEMIRVTFERLVLIENKRVTKTELGGMAHEGCWLHDFSGPLAALGFNRVKVLDDVLGDQDIYMLDLERGADSHIGRRYRASVASRDAEISWLRKHAVREAAAFGAVELQDAVERSAKELDASKASLAAMESELTDALKRRIQADGARLVMERQYNELSAEHHRVSDELGRLDRSLMRRLVKRAKTFDRTYAVMRTVVDKADLAVHFRPLNRALQSSTEVVVPSLPFAKIAHAAMPATPEAFVHAAPRVVGICHPFWRGIRASTYGLCDAVLEIEEITGDDHADAIAEFIREAGSSVVVIQGIPPGSDRLAIRLRKALPKLRILHVFHGSTAQQTYANEVPFLQAMIDLVQAGVIDGLGFVKVGMARCLEREGLPAYPLFNKANLAAKPPKVLPFTGGAMNLGVFVPTSVHKNINTQVMAALAIPNAVVHVNQPPTGMFERYKERLVVHGLLRHDAFLDKLGEMDANLYVTLAECYPMTVIESLERGVVCLTSHTSPIFNEHPELRKALVVSELDDPWAIARQVEQAVANRQAIIALAHEHLGHLNRQADAMWKKFIDG